MVYDSGDVGSDYFYDIRFLLGYAQACRNQANVR
jgi:hypothetical protein